MTYGDVVAIERRWAEHERAWDRRIGMLAFVTARSMGAKVKIEDFVPTEPGERARRNTERIKLFFNKKKTPKGKK